MAQPGTRPPGDRPSVVASTNLLLRRGVVLAGFLIVAGISVFVIALVLAGGAGRGEVEVRLGDDVFRAGRAEALAGTVARSGPVLFADASGLDRDIYVQHAGGDPSAGWSAFAARPEGVGRGCTLAWDPGAEVFAAACLDERFPADGAGLRQYPVALTDDGVLEVDLREAPAP